VLPTSAQSIEVVIRKTNLYQLQKRGTAHKNEGLLSVFRNNS
jgi:hypothetical protein